MVDLEWYRSFVAVYQHGTVSAAAQALQLTQPGVSQHIAALERALATALFHRAPRRMIPTAEGKVLYTQVIDAVERLTAVTPVATTARIQRVRIGAPVEFFSSYVLPRLSRAKELHYSVQYGLSTELVDALSARNLDVIITTQRETRLGIIFHPLFRETFWLVGPRDAEEHHKEDLALLERALRQEPWIAYDPELPIIRRFWRQVFHRRLEILPRLIVPNLYAIRDAVAQGLGFSVLPDYLCEEWVRSQQLQKILAPTPPVSNDLWLAYRKEHQQEPWLPLFLALCRNEEIKNT